jgi:glycosyltransferase involved in cell wall biosynthesis
MKIAFLSSFYPYSGEMPESNARLYRAIEKSNEIKAFNFSLLYPELFFKDKEKFVSENEASDIIISDRILNTANPASYYFSANVINNYKPDIFISRLWMPYLGASIGGTAKFIDKNIKKIAIIDSLAANDKIIFEENVIKLFLNNFDAFITFSNQIKDEIISIKPNAYCVQHPLPFFSADTDKIEKKVARKILRVPTDKKTLLFLGPVRKYKGIDITLQALSMLDDNYHLIIAGESPSGYDYYKRKIRDLQIENKVAIIEHPLNENEMPYIFYSSDVLLMPYEQNPSRNLIRNAFSYELPVIATDVGNFREIFEEKNFGLIIENSDAELLVNAIEKYYDENLETIFKQNLNGLRYGHSWDSLATIIFDIYENLLSQENLTIY